MKVRNVSTGEAVNLDDNPFDMAEIIIPSLNFTYQISNDLGSGNALTMQATGNSMNNTEDWSSSSHFNHSNQRNGQGNIIVLANSNTARLFLRLYNAVNPLGGDNFAKAIALRNNAKNACFDVHYWNQANPNIQAMAEGCYFQNLAQLQVSNGSNNAQDTETWTYLATTVYRDEGDLTAANGQPVGPFNTTEGNPATSHVNTGNLPGTDDIQE